MIERRVNILPRGKKASKVSSGRSEKASARATGENQKSVQTRAIGSAVAARTMERRKSGPMTRKCDVETQKVVQNTAEKEKKWSGRFLSSGEGEKWKILRNESSKVVQKVCSPGREKKNTL